VHGYVDSYRGSDQCISSIFFYKQNNEIGSHCEFPPPKDHDYIYIYIVDEINTTAFNYTVFSHLKIPKR
jgi:hypothetical protein